MHFSKPSGALAGPGYERRLSFIEQVLTAANKLLPEEDMLRLADFTLLVVDLYIAASQRMPSERAICELMEDFVLRCIAHDAPEVV